MSRRSDRDDDDDDRFRNVLEPAIIVATIAIGLIVLGAAYIVIMY